MDEISVKGKKYLKAKVVARELGYTNDYIGQLCRSGKVDAELVGRTWYVDPESVKDHKSSRYRSAKATTKRELKSDVLQAMLEDQKHSSEHFYTKHHIRKHAKPKQVTYQSDEAELIPSLKSTERKSVSLPVELADATQVKVDTDTDKEYHFESPEREETKFFGTLRVTDFMTEVPVEGLNQRAQSVPVSGKPAEEVRVKRKTLPAENKPPLDTQHHTFKTQPLTRNVKPAEKVITPPKTAAIPVTGEEEAMPVPIAYRMVMVAAFILALMVAAASIGLQASVTATNENTDVEYAFTVDNLSALIFPVE